jgi:hypothetical protein
MSVPPPPVPGARAAMPAPMLGEERYEKKQKVRGRPKGWCGRGTQGPAVALGGRGSHSFTATIRRFESYTQLALSYVRGPAGTKWQGPKGLTCVAPLNPTTPAHCCCVPRACSLRGPPVCCRRQHPSVAGWGGVGWVAAVPTAALGGVAGAPLPGMCRLPSLLLGYPVVCCNQVAGAPLVVRAGWRAMWRAVAGVRGAPAFLAWSEKHPAPPLPPPPSLVLCCPPCSE